MVGRTVDLGASIGAASDGARTAFAKLDAIAHLSVESATTTAQPGAPTVDQAYIIPASATGTDWAGASVGQVAIYRGSSFTALSATHYWQFLTPNEGWRAWVRDTDKELIYNSAAWGNSEEAKLAIMRDAGQLQGFKNRVFNGQGAVNQRGAASNADDTYGPDRWNLLTQTGAIAYSILSNPESGAPTGIRLTQSQASAQRFGFSQIFESKNCRDLRSAITTLAGRIRFSLSANVRYAVLEWTGTADAVTSDVVADWTSSTYTNAGFFIGTVNVLATGQLACTAATIRDLTALNATLGASTNNIIILVWTEAVAAQNATLDYWNIQWEPGAVATKYEQIPLSVELARCQRFYEKSFAQATVPAQNAGLTGPPTFGLLTTVGGIGVIPVQFQVTKRGTPTVTLFNPSAANAQARDVVASGDCSSTSAAQASERGFRATFITNGSAANGNTGAIHWTAESEL